MFSKIVLLVRPIIEGVKPPNFSKSLSGGLPQLGYNAAITGGYIKKGEKVTEPVIIKVISSYISFLDGIYKTYELPDDKLYSHIGGTYEGSRTMDTSSVKTLLSIPGWSAYPPESDDPKSLIQKSYSKSYSKDNQFVYSILEWHSNSTNQDWKNALKTSLETGNNKAVIIANCEEYVISSKTETTKNNSKLSSIKALLIDNSVCSVQPSTIVGLLEDGVIVKARFARGYNSDATYVKVYNGEPNNLSHGLVSTVDDSKLIFNGKVDRFDEYIDIGKVSNLKSVYIQVYTDGCNGDRIVSGIIKFDKAKSTVVKESGEQILPTYRYENGLLTVYNDSRMRDLTDSGDISTVSTYINVSTSLSTKADNTFSKIDIANVNMYGNSVYQRDLGVTDKSYYLLVVYDIKYKNRTNKRIVSDIVKI